MTENPTSRRIIICIPTLGLGGAEDIILRLSNGLSGKAKVTLVLLQRCLEDTSRLENLSKDVSVVSLFTIPLSSRSFGFQLRNTLLYMLAPLFASYLFFRCAMLRAHSIHVNLTQAALYSVYWKVLLFVCSAKTTIVQTFHTNRHLVYWWQWAIFRISWLFASKVIFEIDRNEWLQLRRVVGALKTSYIPLCTPGIRLAPKERRTRVVFASLARLYSKEKCYLEILAAAQMLASEGVDFSYLIGGDGPDRTELEEIVERSGLANRVTILGYIHDRIEFFQKVDVLVVATVGTDTGIAGLQALASGIPIIGIDTRRTTLTLGDSDICVSSTAKELACAMKRCLDLNWREEYLERLRKIKASQLSDQEFLNNYRQSFDLQ